MNCPNDPSAHTVRSSYILLWLNDAVCKTQKVHCALHLHMHLIKAICTMISEMFFPLQVHYCNYLVYLKTIILVLRNLRSGDWQYKRYFFFELKSRVRPLASFVLGAVKTHYAERSVPGTCRLGLAASILLCCLVSVASLPSAYALAASAFLSRSCANFSPHFVEYAPSAEVLFPSPLGLELGLSRSLWLTWKEPLLYTPLTPSPIRVWILPHFSFSGSSATTHIVQPTCATRNSSHLIFVVLVNKVCSTGSTIVTINI